MKTLTLLRADGAAVADRCAVADKPLARMRGLLGRRELPPGEGILLRPAGSVHTFFMRFAIDVVFLDSELRVVATRSAVDPWKTARAKGAKSVVELAAGECERLGLAPGDRLLLAA